MTESAQTPVPTYVGRASGVMRAMTLVVLALVVVSALALTITATTTNDRIGGVLSLLIGTAVITGVYLTFSSLTLEVQPAEVVVRYGRSPFRSRIRLDEIREVDTTDVGFLRWGGFGYRGSRRFLRRAAIVVRSGDAVRMHLADDTWLAVTIDEAEQAADAIRTARGG